MAQPATITAQNSYFGSIMPIIISSESAQYTYTLTYKCVEAIGTIATRIGSTTYSWEVPRSLASQIPNSNRAQCQIICQTYDENGIPISPTTSTTVTLRADSRIAPTLTISDEDIGGLNGRYVQGFSSCKLTFSATAQYGASVVGYKVNEAIASSPWTSNIINSAGSVTFQVRAEDSRGLARTVNYTITVEPYARPMISDVTVFRCDSNGAAAEDGAYLSVTATAHYSSIDGQNSISMWAGFKVKGASAYTWQTMTSGTPVIIGNGTIQTNKSYDVAIELDDYYYNYNHPRGATFSYLTVPTATTMLDLRSDMSGIGVGQFSTAQNALQINEDWTIEGGRFRMRDSNGYGWGSGSSMGFYDNNDTSVRIFGPNYPFVMYDENTVSSATLNGSGYVAAPAVPSAPYGNLQFIGAILMTYSSISPSSAMIGVTGDGRYFYGTANATINGAVIRYLFA